jgi:hypothetical protein
MADEQQPASINLESASQIVAAYVRRNQIVPDLLPELILSVHHALRQLRKSRHRANPSGCYQTVSSARSCDLFGLRLERTDAQAAFNHRSRPHCRRVSRKMEIGTRPRDSCTCL